MYLYMYEIPSTAHPSGILVLEHAVQVTFCQLPGSGTATSATHSLMQEP